MSRFLKILSFFFLAWMIFIGVENFIAFLKDTREDIEILYQPPFTIEEERRSRPRDCAHLYNVDKHREWAECMGVGYQ